MKTFGKVAGGIGLLLTLTSLVTVFVSSPVIFFAKLGLGVVLLIVWAVTNGERLAQWTKSIFFYGSSAVLGLAFVAVLIAVNFIAAKRGTTWDLTEKKIHSLSEQTKDTLKDLKEPVKAIVFVAGPVPDSIDALFRRYTEVTDKLTYELKDPRKTPDLTKKYNIRDMQAAAVLVKGSGETESHTTANLGALASAGLGEQELTNALNRLNQVGVQKVYFLTGHGEWPLEPADQTEEALFSSLKQLKAGLIADGYSPEEINLAESNAIPTDAATVIIAGPKNAFVESEKKLIEQYLAQGGRLLYFSDPKVEPGLDAIFAQYGVQLDNGLVADPRINPKQPYLVVAPFYGDHPVTTPLKNAKLNMLFPVTRALTQLREGTLPGVAVTPLVLTTPSAWVETAPTDDPTLDPGEKSGQLALVIASIRDTHAEPSKRSDETRLVVFGTSQLLNSAWSYEPTRNLVLNALGWASNQPKKLTIRPPDREISTLDIDAARLGTIRLVSMDVLPMLLIGIGLTIWLTRRAR